MPTAIALLKQESRRRMIDECLQRITTCVRMLSNEDLWRRPNDQVVSVGNLVLHLAGNIQQWIVSALGGAADDRVRDGEFQTTDRQSADELLARLSRTIHEAVAVIEALPDAAFTADHPVQAFREHGVGIIVHVIEHLSYHTGQIALHTKLATNGGLDFYAGVDLNRRDGGG